MRLIESCMGELRTAVRNSVAYHSKRDAHKVLKAHLF